MMWRSGIFSVALGALVSSTISYALETPTSEVTSEISKSSCGTRAKDLIQGWKSASEWTRVPGAVDGSKTFTSPTDKIGTWVELSAHSDHSLECRNISPERTITVIWKGQDCTPLLKTDPIKGANLKGPHLTDQDLATRVEGKSGIVYEWSPHMPLSVIGYKQAQAVAQKLHISFLPVLDPQADEKAALKAVKANGFPKEAMTRDASLELFERNMHLHYPSTLVFSKGKFGKLYPGHWKSEEIYEKMIQEQLK
jgi:hypothetical protein